MIINLGHLELQFTKLLITEQKMTIFLLRDRKKKLKKTKIGKNEQATIGYPK